ncbi:MAG: DUF2793 domain-containing protein [Bosea sp.]|nr:DUF2793 domain-containing protein [Bosea sp. (in: a-proteobacteria)]
MTTGLLITSAGQSAIAADLGGGTNLVLSHVAFGDASGVPYTPVVGQTALVNERYRATIASVAVMANEIIVDAILPADTPDASSRPSHGFNVWECGLFSSAGTMIGVARMSGGYKPPPSSGQAAVATFRLKLAVSNPSAITVVIDPQAQIILGRHVRPFWMAIDGVLNAPPASPAIGATYVIGAAPTGAWTGFAGRLAQWVGVWSLATAPEGHLVCDNSATVLSASRFLRRSGLSWVSGVMSAAAVGFADPVFVRDQSLNYRTASGTANAIGITLDPAPASWAALEGVPLNIKLTATNTGAATLAIAGLSGTRSILRPGGAPLSPGDLGAGLIARLMYDGAACQLAGLTQRFGGGRLTYDTPGTYYWTVPPGVYSFRGLAKGGGGGGGGTATAALSYSSSGAGGGQGVGDYTCTPGEVITIIVGSPGSGGVGGPSPTGGTAGGSSSISGRLSATGGGPGFAANGAVMTSTSAGGTALGFTAPQRTGSGGNVAYQVGGGNYLLARGGDSADGAQGRDQVTAILTNGAPGANPGDGGNGAALGGSGGNGAPGRVVIEF